MKRNFLFALLLGAAAFTWSCGNSADETSTNNDTAGMTSGNPSMENTNTPATGQLSDADREFMMNAAAANKMELDAANTANQNSQNQSVKGYADMMIRDHTKAGNELMSFASSQGVTLPDSLPAEARQHMQAMANMKGKSFDAHYMKMMTEDHAKVISQFENASNTASNPQLKEWATNTLPVLRAHLDSAKAIVSRM